MNDDELDARLTAHLRAVADAAPTPAPFPADRVGASIEPVARRSSDRHRFLSAAAAAVVVLAGVTAAWMASGSDGELMRTGPDDEAENAQQIEVQRETLDVELTWDLDCNELEVGLGPSPITLNAETWWSPELQRIRQRWIYPDQTMTDLLRTGDPWAPGEERRVARTGGDVIIGCADQGVQLSEPGAAGLFMLNPVDSPGYVPLLDDADARGAQSVPGTHEDRYGRPADLRRLVTEGEVGRAGEPQLTITETTDWLLEPGTDRVLERRFVRDYDGIGTVGWSAVLVDDGPASVPDYVFDIAGVAEGPDSEGALRHPPDDPHGTRASTTIAPGASTGGCNVEALLDITSVIPDGFTGPNPGMGGADDDTPVPCARHWQGSEPGMRITQRNGLSVFPVAHDGQAGEFRWGRIEGGFVLEHAVAPAWSVYAYGIDAEAFERLYFPIVAER